ncbi:MAG: metal-sensitive transcriptional regulator [bacterium]
MNELEEKKLERRLRLIEGQVRGIIRLLSEDRSPVEILTQISAIQEGLKGVARSIMREYLTATTYSAIRSRNRRERTRFIEQLLSTLFRFSF